MWADTVAKLKKPGRPCHKLSLFYLIKSLNCACESETVRVQKRQGDRCAGLQTDGRKKQIKWEPQKQLAVICAEVWRQREMRTEYMIKQPRQPLYSKNVQHLLVGSQERTVSSLRLDDFGVVISVLLHLTRHHSLLSPSIPGSNTNHPPPFMP